MSLVGVSVPRSERACFPCVSGTLVTPRAFGYCYPSRQQDAPDSLNDLVEKISPRAAYFIFFDRFLLQKTRRE